MMQPEYFKSTRLIYRATEDEDETFFLNLDADMIGKSQADASPLQPASKNSAKGTLAWLKTCVLAVIICLPPQTADEMPTPIGHIALTGSAPRDVIHREPTIAVRLLPPYRGQGFGTEAIEWACDYAFGIVGMHRVGIGYYEWNDGARRLYERLGFVPECRRREARWHQGRWWDVIDMGMLEREWRATRKFDEKGTLLLGQ